jgi:stress response protein SCP2
MGINLGGNNNNASGGLTLGGSQPQQQGGLNLGGSGGLDLSRGATPQAPVAQSTGGLQLSKGQKLDITKGNPGLDALRVGLGWDVGSGTAFDLDTEIFLLGADGRVVSPNHVIFYNNLVSPDGAVKHNGDNRTGEGAGDDETVDVTLSRISPDVQKLVFVVTIDQAMARRQNFGQVSNAYIRIVNQANGQELCRFDLTEDHSASISIVAGEVYRHNSEWKFGAVEQGSTNDLAGLCVQYGAM